VAVIDGAPKRTTEVTTERWSRTRRRRGQAARHRGETTGPYLKVATRQRMIACLGGHIRGHTGARSMVSANSTTTVVVVAGPYIGAGPRTVRPVIATGGQGTCDRHRRPPMVISAKVQTDVQGKVNGCTTATSQGTYYRAGPRKVTGESKNRAPKPRRGSNSWTSRPSVKASSSDCQSGNIVTRSRKDYIRPQNFLGTGSFEMFYAHFQKCAAYNRWTEKDQLAHLKACLTSDAGQFLWDSSPEATDTSQKLTNLLRNRFGAVRQQDKHRMELRLRRRRSQETLSALHQDVRTPHGSRISELEHSSRETLACDYFIDALDDAHFALKVRERMPVTLDDALRYALQLEAWMKTADQIRGQNRSSSQDEPVHHKLKGRGATGGANEQPLGVGRLAEMIKSAVERSIN